MLNYFEDLYLIDELADKYSKIWTTMNGRRIRVKDMATKHLQNTINFLVKNDGDKEWIDILEEEFSRRAERRKHSG